MAKKPDILSVAKRIVALLAKSGLSVNDQYRAVSAVESALPEMKVPEVAQ